MMLSIIIIMPTTLSNTLLFLFKNAKNYHIFPTKKMCIKFCNRCIKVQNFNKMFTNVVNFEQPVPVFYKGITICEERYQCQPRREKTGFLHMRKQRRRSASR